LAYGYLRRAAIPPEGSPAPVFTDSYTFHEAQNHFCVPRSPFPFIVEAQPPLRPIAPATRDLSASSMSESSNPDPDPAPPTHLQPQDPPTCSSTVTNLRQDSDAVTCIVCLIDLPQDSIPITGEYDPVARLVPCNHAMHNSCLMPWMERANSCPICRRTFNQVSVSTTLSGTNYSLSLSSRPIPVLRGMSNMLATR